MNDSEASVQLTDKNGHRAREIARGYDEIATLIAAGMPPAFYLKVSGLMRTLKGDAKGIVLDIGCGGGNLPSVLATDFPHHERVGIDVSRVLA